MGAYANLGEWVNRKTGGNSGAPEFLPVHKEWRVGGAALTAPQQARWNSFWLLEGMPSHGAAPAAAASPDRTTVGGLLQTAPGGGLTKWLDSVVACSGINGALVLYDRLYHCGGFSGTNTGAQAAGASAITRNTGGQWNQIWIEVSAAIGATATTATISYTNQAGTAGQVTPPFAIGGTGASELTRAIPVPLANGDSGVRSVQSITLLASTLTAGDFAIVIARPLVMLGTPGGLASSRTPLDGPMPDVSSACLGFMFLSGSTVAPLGISVGLATADR